MNLTRALGSVGGLTLASRVLGLVRDSLFARFVGAGFASDAFLVAFRLPNLFRALFAEGAFSAAFVPMFNRKVGDKTGAGLPDGISFAQDVLSVLFPILIVMTIVLELLAWPVTLALSGKFNGVGPDQFAFAVLLSRLTIPYLMLISLVSLLGQHPQFAASILGQRRRADPAQPHADRGPAVLPRLRPVRHGAQPGARGHRIRRVAVALAYPGVPRQRHQPAP